MKQTVFTTITPLPSYISRDIVVETLHNHKEMIELNPLVINFARCKPPSFAPADEFHTIWYELTDRISYLPGGLLHGNVSYKGCFHDLPRGLQTHVYAPTGLDIRDKWTVCGNMPGEPRETIELGLPEAPQGGIVPSRGRPDAMSDLGHELCQEDPEEGTLNAGRSINHESKSSGRTTCGQELCLLGFSDLIFA